MPASVRSVTTGRSAAPAPAVPLRRRPFRDNPRLILAGIGVLVAALVAILTVAKGSPRFTPDFLSEFVLYALTAADLTMLVALVFVLARKRREADRRTAARAALRAFSREARRAAARDDARARRAGARGRQRAHSHQRGPLVQRADGRHPVVSHQIAGDYYHERQLLVSDQASQIARTLGAVDLVNPDAARIRELIAPDIALQRVQTVDVYRVAPAARGALPGLEPVLDIATPALRQATRASPPTASRHRRSLDHRKRGRLKPWARPGSAARCSRDQVEAGRTDDRRRGCHRLPDRRSRRELAPDDAGVRRLQPAARPEAAVDRVYLSFFLMVTLMILVSAIWMGLYLAKRITRPVQMLARPLERLEPAGSISGSSLRATTNSGR